MRSFSRPVLALMVVAMLAGCSTAASPPASVGPAATADATPSPVTSQPPDMQTPEATGTSAASALAVPAEVAIVDFAFEPATIQVQVGQVVRWSNEGGQPHTVKSVDGSISSAIVLRDPFEWTAVGETNTEIAYVCSIHPAMTGTITIVE